MTVRILQGDCREVLPTLDACSVDAIVTDPPYGLGFMGKGWDHGVPGAEFWTEAMRVAKPGAYLLAFGGTRTYHRLACAIEDAGWEIRDQIGWAFGSGFPKSHNGPWGGTALKPAWEPICVARKPLIGTVAANWKAHGTGALNIDACRIGIDAAVDDPRLGGKGDWSSDKMAKNVYEGGYAGERVGSSPLGRWPANLIHDGSEEVLAAFPDSVTARIEKPSDCRSDGATSFDNMRGNRPARGYDGEGSAARFFYCAKADKTDREDGLRGSEVRPLAYGNQAQAEVKRGNTAHAGDSGMNTVKMRGNHHPTVKPTDLMRYLVRLVTPKLVMYCPSCEGDTSDSTKTASSGTSMRDVRDEVSATRQPEGGAVLQQGMRVPSARVADGAVPPMRDDVQAIARGEQQAEHVLQSGLFRESNGAPEAQGWRSKVSEGIHPHSSAGAPDGDARGLCDGTPPCDGREVGPDVDGGRDCSPSQREKGGQPTGESGTDAQSASRPPRKAKAKTDSVPPLPGADRGQRTCPKCEGPLAQRAGVVLDPFMGSGSTLKAAELEGFSAIGIELDADYCEIARRRIASDAPLFAEVA